MTKPSTTWQAFRFPDFRWLFTARIFGLTSLFMLNVAMGQYVYEQTHSALHLGYIGLSFFLPKLLFTLIGGHTADRYDRRQVLLVCRSVEFLIVLALAIGIWKIPHSLPLIYALLFLFGVVVAFDGPAGQAILPQVVDHPSLGNAVTWNASSMQIAMVSGPVLCGWIYAWTHDVRTVLIVIVAMRLVSALFILGVRKSTVVRERGTLSLETLLAGLRYVFEKKVLLGVISLDLFAVLLGGAVALLPVYANDILKVGPSGFGMLRAAPAAGAAVMALWIARNPPRKNAGLLMFISVAIFGLATVAFGLSKHFYFSLASLAVLGAADMVSVVIRGVLVQTQTPPEMRGRVSAVNLIFIGASNELGEFESGLTAAWLGTVPAVVLGGVGTLLVVLIWSRKFRKILEFRDLHGDFR